MSDADRGGWCFIKYVWIHEMKLSNKWYRSNLFLSSRYHKTTNISHNLVSNNISWSFRCSWIIVCWRCSNYIFILHLPQGFNGFGQKQLQDEKRNIQVLGFGAYYIRGLTLMIKLGMQCFSHETDHQWSKYVKDIYVLSYEQMQTRVYIIYHSSQLKLWK